MGGGLFYCCRSGGFSPEKISSRLPYNPDWEIEALTEEQRRLFTGKIFAQNYYYLSSGRNCYAFISEDREYILKFFKNKSLFPKDVLGGFLQKLGLKNEMVHQLFSERIYANYIDAYESLREESGLLYLHLNKTDGLRSVVTLIDGKGNKIPLQVDKVEYVVQKSAKRIYDHLNALVKEKNEEGLMDSIRSFLHLIARRCEKGFVDQDFNLSHDFGFVGNKAIQFDCASLAKDNSMKFFHNFRNELMQAAERLDDWAEEMYPEASFFIQDEAQRLINQKI